MLSNEIRALLEKQLSSEYQGIIRDVFEERDKLAESLKREESRNNALSSSNERLESRLNEFEERNDSLTEKNNSLAADNERLKFEASSYPMLKLQADQAAVRTNDYREMMAMIFGNVALHESVLSHERLTDRMQDGSSYERLEPKNTDITKVSKVQGAGND